MNTFPFITQDTQDIVSHDLSTLISLENLEEKN